MRPYLTRKQISDVATSQNISYEDAKQMLNAIEIEEADKESNNQKIIDRINKRIQGEYVVPVWVERLKGL